jgi:hypothetical protein
MLILTSNFLGCTVSGDAPFGDRQIRINPGIERRRVDDDVLFLEPLELPVTALPAGTAKSGKEEAQARHLHAQAVV